MDLRPGIELSGYLLSEELGLQTVPVFFRPGTPRVAVLRQGANSGHYGLIAGSAGILFLGLVLSSCLLAQVRTRRRLALEELRTATTAHGETGAC